MNRLIFLGVAAASAMLVVLVGGWTASGAGGASRPTATPPGSPAAFMARIVRMVAANRYGEAWDGLDPAQKRLVPRAGYVACESLSPIPGHVESLRVLSVRDTLLVVPGSEGAVPAKAIGIRLAIAGSGPGERTVVTHTYHAVASKGGWRWFLPAQRLSTYLAGGCPGYAPAPTYGGDGPTT